MTVANITRRFRELDKSPTPATVRAQLGRYAKFNEETWASVLLECEKHEKCCAIVIEAGSGTGKTTELTEQYRQLKAKGKPVFSFRARDLATRGWQSSLSNDDAEAYRRWGAKSEQAIVFVDAVDEIYLDHKTSFDLFRELERNIDLTAKRLALILSVRTGSWNREEARSLQHFLGVSESQRESESRAIRYVSFEPLDRIDIECLATFYRARDVSKFMQAFVENEVSDLMEIRPQDVRVLVEYWNHRSKLGSWSEIAKWQLVWTYACRQSRESAAKRSRLARSFCA